MSFSYGYHFCNNFQSNCQKAVRYPKYRTEQAAKQELAQTAQLLQKQLNEVNKVGRKVQARQYKFSAKPINNMKLKSPMTNMPK